MQFIIKYILYKFHNKKSINTLSQHKCNIQILLENRNRYYKEYNYSWDFWDFIDPDTEEKLGYDDSTDQMMDIIWKVLDKGGETFNRQVKIPLN